jgi:hypothetical protein
LFDYLRHKEIHRLNISTTGCGVGRLRRPLIPSAANLLIRLVSR